MKACLRKLFTVLLALSFLGLAQVQQLDAVTKDSLSLTPLTASQVRDLVSESKGHVVWVNVWATWCQPCVEEFPILLDLQKKHQEKGLKLILLSADSSSNRKETIGFLKKQGVVFPTYIKSGSDQEFIDGLSKKWQGSLPANFLFGRNGELIDFWEGEISRKEIETRVEKSLSKTVKSKKGS